MRSVYQYPRKIRHNMRFLPILFSMVVFGLIGTAYAEPLEEVSASILESTDSVASIGISWNNDSLVSSYEIGCVSCIPNFSENTTNDKAILNGVTSFENGTALLYVIAYDENDEIISAKQVVLNLN